MAGAHAGCSCWVLVLGATSQRQLEALSPGGARRAVGHARAHAAERVEHAVLVLEPLGIGLGLGLELGLGFEAG